MDLFYPFLKVEMPFEYILAVIIVLIIGCVCFWHNKKPKEWFYFIFLVAYIILVLGKTVVFRKTGAVEDTNTYPFWSYVEGFTKRKYVLGQIILNIVLFLPIGFFLGGIIKSRRFVTVLFIGAAISISIELMQLVFSKGLCEFDDVFHNTAGCILGLLLLNGIRKTLVCKHND